MCIIEAFSNEPPYGLDDDMEVMEKVFDGEPYPRPDGMTDDEWKFVGQLLKRNCHKRIKLTDAIETLKGFAGQEAAKQQTPGCPQCDTIGFAPFASSVLPPVEQFLTWWVAITCCLEHSIVNSCTARHFDGEDFEVVAQFQHLGCHDPTGPPWTAEEHQRFLNALEQFGGGQSSTIGEAWQSIATAVGTRDMMQVVQHARVYFVQLQQLNVQKRQERHFMQSVDQRWTAEEDAAFESMLATFSSSSVCYPWETMAARLPGKSPVDLKERYQKLCYDVGRIESGQHVTMQLGQFHRHPGLPLSTKAAAIGESGRLASQMSTPHVLDCVVTLTPAEEQILVSAMAEVFVPPEAPADLLAGIASAVAAFTSSNGRVPPQRTHPLFTKEQALEVLNGLLAARQTNPQAVLETLATQLRLTPRGMNVSAGVSFSTTGCAPSATTSEAESAEPNLHLLATTGLTFGSMLPSPSPLGAELSLGFEIGSTPRFLSSLGLLSPSPRLHFKGGDLPPLTPSALHKNNNS